MGGRLTMGCKREAEDKRNIEYLVSRKGRERRENESHIS